jgi:glycosidase
MIKTNKTILLILIASLSMSCTSNKSLERNNKSKELSKKIVIYQVFTRLFGNTNTTNKPWGTIEENGVGKFNDFTNKALLEIKNLGVTHIWYTGVPHHGLIKDYGAFGISNDDPDVIKGRAGSPYAVKDYYNVNPDLAVHIENRLEEFEALIRRSHKNKLKVLIDIVPNHVARNYQSISNPEGTKDFGEDDRTDVVYDVNNNFYYLPNDAFKVPDFLNNYQPLGGEKHALSDMVFYENPAKWTGNGVRSSKPSFYDWYETVKVNYGISPDGKKHFPELPAGFEQEDYKTHFKFWQDKKVPDSWLKFRDIALYWLDKGVDGFRYDMAEMVPVEFWSFMNSAIKMNKADAFLLAEVYNPSLYRDYIKKGKMDYLYDKVQLYDTLKSILKGRGFTDNIPPIQEDLKDIEHHMLHFLENHDEQRIASPEFLGDAQIAKPAMVVSATISTAPTLIYFGQELGEDGSENAGFGTPSRTSIFDYVGVPAFQRWVNNKKFDAGQSTNEERSLRDFYKRLLNFTITSSALMGTYQDIHQYNREQTKDYSNRVLSYGRWSSEEKLLIVSNFNSEKGCVFKLSLPPNMVKEWELKDGEYHFKDQLYQKYTTVLKVKGKQAKMRVEIEPLASFILKLQ